MNSQLKTLFVVCIVSFLFISSVFQNGYAVEFVTENLPPLQIEGKMRKHDGAMVELIELLMSESNVKGNISVLPWPRAYQFALKTPDTFIFSMRKAAEREKLFHWVGIIYEATPMVAALTKRNDIKVTDINDLHQYTIGVVRGDYDEIMLRRLGLADNLYLALSYKELWKMLQLERLDCVMTTKVVANQIQKELNIKPDDVKMIYEILDSNSKLFLGANIETSSKLVEKLRESLASVKKDGRYQQILDKWGV